MKRWLPLAIVFLVGLAALIVSERRKAEAPVSPDAILYFLADTQRELSRLPVRATRLSDAEEIEIGNALARHYELRRMQRRAEREAEVRATEAYVQSVGARVAARARRKLPYKFHYIPNMDFINAFALPGGHVFIAGGLMALMDSEDQLAAVLGHEIEHIDHYHCAERVQVEARLRKLRLGVLEDLVTFPIELFQVGYSKAQELEADREGTTLAVWASYSPLGAIRMFEAFARLRREYLNPPKTPQEELSRVALETLAGYFKSHPDPSERIEQIRKMIAEQRWGGQTQERTLEVAYVFWTERARRAYEAHRYEQAAKLAAESLKVQPDQPEALKILAQSQFALAEFAGAAASYRKLLEKTPTDLELIRNYADALAATGSPQIAAKELVDWKARQQPAAYTNQLELDLAGLQLMAGDEKAMNQILERIKVSPGAVWVPESLGRLGWWAYRAGQYERAVKLLQLAVQQRPGKKLHETGLGWTLIEQRNFEEALRRFGSSMYGVTVTAYDRWPVAPDSSWGPEARMGQAVTRWQARQQDEALLAFGQAFELQPQWLNPRWVKALYSPLVARSVTELKLERQKRLAARGRPAVPALNPTPSR